jgi:hypothetical protein
LVGESIVKKIAIALLLCMVATSVEAANRFWVGGTGNWDAVTTTHWASGSGGAGGQSVPVAGDVVTFDSNSGGGTVTPTVNIDVGAIISNSFAGTLAFDTNNVNVNLNCTCNTFVSSGTGVRTINLGNGTWTMTGGGWDFGTTTNMTFNANSSTLIFNSNGTQAQLFTHGAKTYNIVTVGARTQFWFSFNGGSHTIATVNINAPNIVNQDQNVTTTITNAANWVGTPSKPIYLYGNSNSLTTVSFGSNSTCNWCAIGNMTKAGAGTFTITNSFGLSNNTGLSISGPGPFNGGQPGACIIGGWLLWRDMPEHINDNFPAWLEKAG